MITRYDYTTYFHIGSIMISYNLEQNICRSFHFLAKFLFTTSETKLDYHQKVNVRVSSRVTEQIKT